MRQPGHKPGQKGELRMKIVMTQYLDCSCDFSHGAKIRTESGRSLGATCNPEEAEKIIKEYFLTEFFPETVYVYFGGEIGQDGLLGYTFSLAE
jgi:hypothetical protein